jgi:glycosyltransferase involved in cell wall biosynthesis
MKFQINRIAIAFTNFRHLYGDGGGLQRNRWNIAMEYIKKGFEVDLLAFNADGIEHIPQTTRVNCYVMNQHGSFTTRITAMMSAPRDWRQFMLRPVGIPLNIAHTLRRLPSVMSYLNSRSPDILIGGGTQVNLCIVIAKVCTKANTRIIVSEHNPLSYTLAVKKHVTPWRWRYLPPLLRQAYIAADGLVAVSHALAEDLEYTLKLPPGKVQVIYNPVVNEDLWARMQEPLDHPWFNDHDIPVLLNVARIVPMKDQETLLKAFALARAHRPMKLIILGNGPDYVRLQNIARELKVQSDVEMPGFEPNPIRFMARADAFVLTSISEGFGNVLVEAMAAGCPVVSTNCKAGPAEILDNGRYGRLVEVGNPNEVCRGILETLENPPPKEMLKDRARIFSAETAANEYLKIASSKHGKV